MASRLWARAFLDSGHDAELGKQGGADQVPRIGPVTRWLEEDQQRSWRALVMGTTLLMDRLDADLRASFKISLTEYEILVRLSEQPDHQMRMAQLADAMCHSRSRVTHTVQRMQRAGLLERIDSPEDGRGVLARMTDAGSRDPASAPRTYTSPACAPTWSTWPPPKTSQRSAGS